MAPITTITGYKFIRLAELSILQDSLLEKVKDLSCRGTILLSTEGININLSGLPENIRAFQAYLWDDARFSNMIFRENYSAAFPFKQMKVKVKAEIITLNKPEIQVEKNRAPSLSPQELKSWLDEKRDVTILDTRNDYEVRFGTFENATHLNLKNFSEFPEESDVLSKEKPVVMFCTGGIRCEKAALHLLNAGFPEVYQLEGGILNYFAQVGGEHYRGECFVFDQRVALSTALAETGTQQCLICQGPITLAEQTSDAVQTCAFCVG
jgi:UPF0176 protein